MEKEEIKVKVKLLNKDAKLPSRNKADDAGADLFSCETVVIPARSGAKIKTGVAIALPPSTVGIISDRSSMGSKGLKVHGGVIDAGYRGEVIVVLWNHSDSDYQVTLGDKIAQLIVYNCLFPSMEAVDSLDETERGGDGFGSSGK